MARLLEWWRQADPAPPAFLRSYPAREQARREAHLDRYLEAVEAELRAAPRSRPWQAAAEERLTAAFCRFAREALDFEDRHLDLLLAGGFTETGREFARAARLFDPSMGASDVFQASRNVWTTNGLQVLLGLPARLTPAIFAYSCSTPVPTTPSITQAFQQADKLRIQPALGRAWREGRLRPPGRTKSRPGRWLA